MSKFSFIDNPNQDASHEEREHATYERLFKRNLEEAAHDIRKAAEKAIRYLQLCGSSGFKFDCASPLVKDVLLAIDEAKLGVLLAQNAYAKRFEVPQSEAAE